MIVAVLSNSLQKVKANHLFKRAVQRNHHFVAVLFWGEFFSDKGGCVRIVSHRFAHLPVTIGHLEATLQAQLDE
jgi:hypothetical protein